MIETNDFPGTAFCREMQAAYEKMRAAVLAMHAGERAEIDRLNAELRCALNNRESEARLRAEVAKENERLKAELAELTPLVNVVRRDRDSRADCCQERYEQIKQLTAELAEARRLIEMAADFTAPWPSNGTHVFAKKWGVKTGSIREQVNQRLRAFLAGHPDDLPDAHDLRRGGFDSPGEVMAAVVGTAATKPREPAFEAFHATPQDAGLSHPRQVLWAAVERLVEIEEAKS